MTETCLFLPDNLMAVLYEEQKLIQSLVSFPFRKTIPLFKTKKKFDYLTIYPPILSGSLIVRPCNSPDSFEVNGGFILGDAREEAKTLFLQLESLKQKTSLFFYFYYKNFIVIYNFIYSLSNFSIQLIFDYVFHCFF